MTLQYTFDDRGKPIGVFIPISEWKKITKKHKDLDISDAPSKADILESIKDGLRQAKEHQKGKLKLKSAQQLLDEL